MTAIRLLMDHGAVVVLLILVLAGVKNKAASAAFVTCHANCVSAFHPSHILFQPLYLGLSYQQ